MDPQTGERVAQTQIHNYYGGMNPMMYGGINPMMYGGGFGFMTLSCIDLDSILDLVLILGVDLIGQWAMEEDFMTHFMIHSGEIHTMDMDLEIHGETLTGVVLMHGVIEMVSMMVIIPLCITDLI